MVGSIKQTQGGSGPTINIRAPSLRAPVKDIKAANYMPGVQGLARGLRDKADRDQRESEFARQERLRREALAQQAAQAASGRSHRSREAELQREHQKALAHEARKNRLSDFAARKNVEANILEENYERENERDMFKRMSPEQLAEMGFTPEQIKIIPHAPPGTAMKMREANRKQSNKFETMQNQAQLQARIKEKLAQQKREAAQAAQRKDINATMGNFGAMARELSKLSDRDIKLGIGASGKSEAWQTLRNWMGGGGDSQKAKLIIDQYLGNLESELMGTLKGNPSDRDVAIAVAMIRKARDAETPKLFYDAIRRAQEIMARKAGLKQGEYEPFAKRGSSGGWSMKRVK